MKMEMKYVAPEVEILEIEVEKGFVESATDPGQTPGNPFE